MYVKRYLLTNCSKSSDKKQYNAKCKTLSLSLTPTSRSINFEKSTERNSIIIYNKRYIK